jgi:hypothetical protein
MWYIRRAACCVRSATTLRAVAIDTVSAIPVQIPRRTISAVPILGWAFAAPRVIVPATMNPILSAAVQIAVIERPVRPSIVIKDRAVINGLIPVVIGTTIFVTIAIVLDAIIAIGIIALGIAIIVGLALSHAAFSDPHHHQDRHCLIK